MKIYTSSKSKFGKELKILNEKVKFNQIGEAEVDDKLGKAILEYSDVYSDEPIKVEEKVEEPEKKDNKNEGEVAELKNKIEKFKKQDEARVVTIKELKNELNDFKEAFAKLAEENKALKESKQADEEKNERKDEVEKFRKELEEKEVEELKDTCAKMEIEESQWKRLQKKEKIIDVIIKYAFE